MLIALSLGRSNFAASIGLGASGIDARARLRIGVIFGLFETAHWVGAALLIGTGLDALIQAVRSRNADDGEDQGVTGSQLTGRILVTGLALSIDNLAVGFALGTYHVSLLLAAVVIGAVSVGLSLLGLELGSHLGAKIGERSEYIGGLVLIGVEVALGTGTL